MPDKIHKLSPDQNGNYRNRSFVEGKSSISISYDNQHKIYLTHDQILELALYVLEKCDGSK